MDGSAPWYSLRPGWSLGGGEPAKGLRREAPWSSRTIGSSSGAAVEPLGARREGWAASAPRKRSETTCEALP